MVSSRSDARGSASLPPLVAIVGPTAVGKTATSIRLAQRFDGEILSADSRQLYRGMDIGTAKATEAERATVVHHLIDICDPLDTLSLAEFQEMAYRTMADVVTRGRIPFLVGGTGLYVRAVIEGYGIPRVAPDEALRDRLFDFAEREGHQALHERLAAVDREAAASIDPRNVRRVVRAIEVYEKSGIPISILQRKQPPPYRILQIGLTRDRKRLYERVDRRIEKMLQDGLLDEVRGFLEAGVPPDCETMSGLGYREAVDFLRGEIESKADLAAEIGRNTRRFIRSQYNWFRLKDPKINWFDLDESGYEEIERFVGQWLRKGMDGAEAHG